MNIMTKRGSQDNVVTYEHYCDNKQDLANIPQDQITLGSVAIVLEDEDESMGIYIANSHKQWISFSSNGGAGDMENISLTNLLDISLDEPTDGQTLVYNATSEKWENGDTGNFIIHVNEIDVLDKTFNEINNAILQNKNILLQDSVGDGVIFFYYLIKKTDESISFATLPYMNDYNDNVSINYIIIDNNNDITKSWATWSQSEPIVV